MARSSDADLEARMLRMALEESSREAAERAMIENALRASLRDVPQPRPERDMELARAMEAEILRERRKKSRGPDTSLSPPSDANDSYPHTALPGLDFIRVLTILPSNVFHETINCTIEPQPLDVSSWYSAVSYSWGMNDTGDACRSRTIVVDGTPFHITQNLFDCLLRIRDRRRPRRIWVDAICINQNDVSERSAQVARMAEIYKNAEKVLVWLGEGAAAWEDEQAYYAFKWFSVQSGRIAQNSETGWNDGEADRIFAKLGLDRAGNSGQKMWRPVIRALNKIWSRRYFTRRWIVQGLAYAPSLRILWGAHKCSYADFVDGAEQACSIALEMLNVTGRIDAAADTITQSLAEETIRLTQRVRDVTQFHNSSAPDRSRNICYALSHCNALRCMDERDILYALAKIDPAFQLAPDYNASTSAVYIGFARKLVEMSLLEVLLVNTKSNRIRPDRNGDGAVVLSSLNLPSWVPDLRSPFIDIAVPPTALEASVYSNARRGDILRCELLCLGTLSDHGHWREGIVTIASLGSAQSQQVNMSPHQDFVISGDLACCTVWGQGHHVIFLRQKAQYHEIVHVMGQHLFTLMPFTDSPATVKTPFHLI